MQRKIMLFVFMFILVLSLVPQVHGSSVVEKFPTETSVITEGWENPTAVYADDGNSAMASCVFCEQQYEGFGFNFNETNVIDRVFLMIDWQFFQFILVEPNEWGKSNFNIKIFNGEWHTCYHEEVENLMYYDASYVVVQPKKDWVDVTEYISTPSLVNNVKLRMESDFIGDYTEFYYYIDSLSLTVTYTTPSHEKSWFIAGEFILILPISFMAIIAFVIILKKKR